MMHICNECKFRDECEEKFIDTTGILCGSKNLYFRQNREKEWSEYAKEFLEYLDNG